jgi:hypothetical protein
MTTTTFAHVVDGVVRAVGLPSTGTLSDGSSVSGFEFLSPDVLSTEGWLPVVEIHSELSDGEQWGAPVFTVEEGAVFAHFAAEPIPPPEPDPMADMQAQLAAQQALIDELLAALGGGGNG